MTLQEHIAQLQKQRDALVSARNKALKSAALDTNARVARRIFSAGLAQSGQIGQYSTKRMLATRNQFTRKSAFKRTGWVKFPGEDKAVPVMELPNGYKQLRSIQGKAVGRVNLDYSGALMRDFSNSVRPYKRGYAAIVKQTRNAEIINKMELKYRKRIFSLGIRERDYFFKTFKAEFNRWTSAL